MTAKKSGRGARAGAGRAPATGKGAGKSAPARPSDEAIAAFLAGEGFRWLSLPNVVGVSVAEKESGGKGTGELAVKFDVVAKLDSKADIVRAGSRPFPESIEIGGHRLPTDVVERWPEPHSAPRKSRIDPVRGGISVGNRVETGTLGAIVWHRASGKPVALSNWHVLANPRSDGTTLQPGSFDDSATGTNRLGRLQDAILDAGLDAAVTSIDHRGFAEEIAELGVAVTAVARPTSGMKVVKSGRTTEVTFGVVTLAQKLISLPISGLPERHDLSVCMIEPDPSRPSNGPLCGVGDSGACWMLRVGDRATGTMVALHVAGDNVAIAYGCDAEQVFSRLGLEPLAGRGTAPQRELLAPPPPVAVGAGARPHRVIARDGLRIRGGPDTSFERIGGRAFGEIVSVVGSQGAWHMVDLQGDGRVDGFMLGALLEPLDD